MSLETPTLLLATTLMELSQFLTQGRAVFPYHRIRSSPCNDELSNKSLFESLPLADYSEEQAFFVMILNARDIEPSGSVLSPVCEIRLRDVSSLHPVTEAGKEIFNGSQRLKGVVLADARFESSWHSFVSNRYATHTLGMVLDLADEVVPCSIVNLGPLANEFKASIVAKHLGLENVIRTPFSRFIYELLNYKRETDKNYDSEQLKVMFIDLFKIIVASGAPKDLCDLGRQFVKSPLIKKDLSIDQNGLISLFTDKEYQLIIQKISRYFACGVSWIHAAILYLCIRLDKQNGKARNLQHYVDAIRSLGVFDIESTRLGLLLVALPESQSSLNEFVNATKQSELGIFNLSPVKPTEKVRHFEQSFFETIENLMIAKIAESEIKNASVAVISVTDEVPGASDENLVAASGSESQAQDPSAPEQKDEASQAEGGAEGLAAAEGPCDAVSNDSSSDGTQKQDDAPDLLTANSDASPSSHSSVD